MTPIDVLDLLLPPPARRREIRVASQLSLQDIADLLGVTRSAVSRWERDERRPSGATRRSYIRASGSLSEAQEQAWGWVAR